MRELHGRLVAFLQNSEVPITENGRKSGEQIVRTGQVEFSLIKLFPLRYRRYPAVRITLEI